MSALKSVGVIYLILSCVCLIGTFFVLLFEDIRLYRESRRKTMSKFGYNLRWNGLGWIMLLGCLPGLNLIILIYFFLPNWIGTFTDSFRDRRATARASNK
jgi:hypothetical protein